MDIVGIVAGEKYPSAAAGKTARSSIFCYYDKSKKVDSSAEDELQRVCDALLSGLTRLINSRIT